jgi:hypothetical protein
MSDTATAATITLGADKFEIPELPLGVQQRLYPITTRMMKRSLSAQSAGSEALLEIMMDEENLKDTQMTVAIGMAYISKDFTPAAFESLIAREFEGLSWKNPPITLTELMAASMTITLQAGGKKVGEAMPATLKNLLAKAVPAANSISTESSPTSASQPDGNGITSNGQSPADDLKP